MTNEHGIVGGGTAIVNPTPATSTTSPGDAMKHTLRSASKTKTTDSLEDAALVKEEDKMMVDDEEVTSVEDNAEAAERTMLTVALVHSVVESHGKPGRVKTEDTSGSTTPTADDKKPTDDGPVSPGRYGLRKRRRPSGQDLERLEESQSADNRGQAVKQEDDPGKPENVKIKLEDNENGEKGVDSSIQSSGKKKETPAIQPPLPPSALKQRPKQAKSKPRQPKAKKAKASPGAAGQDVPLGPTIVTSVPNPLALSVPAPSALSDEAPAVELGSTVTPANVPCPLSSKGSEVAPPPVDAPVTAPPVSADKRKVTINEPPVGRKRGFSIDMDLVLDFPDDTPGSEGGGRSRTYSFECFAFGINADEPLPPLEQGGLTSDGPGPLDPLSMNVHGRPRGDSIIFDPVSFQDGGIHEQHALERATGESPLTVLPKSSTNVSAPRVTTTKRQSGSSTPAPLSLPSSPPVLPPIEAAHGDLGAPTVHTISTGSASPALGATITATTVAGAGTTFSMDLLNKDGRIGIYLPEARRARIARFHEKRSRRIWRKRIKYDCRKKLADSRPRIKGRFVKRTDTED